MRCASYILAALLSLALPVAAQTDTLSLKERLTKEMYRLFSTDSTAQFMAVTEQLKEMALRENDEELFYRAWSNQANHNFSRNSRDEGLRIAREEQVYAQAHNSKVGIYKAMCSLAGLKASANMTNDAEKEYLKCIDYQKRYFPEENSAFAYIGLCRIWDKRNDNAKLKEYGYKALSEPNVIPVHQVHAWTYVCQALFKEWEKNKTEANRQAFNKGYAARAKAVEAAEGTNPLGDVVRYEEALVNGRIGELVGLADKISSRQNRLAFLAEAYYYSGDYKNAYLTHQKFKRLADSLNTEEVIKTASDYGLQMDVMRTDLELQKRTEHIHHLIMGGAGLVALLIIGFLAFYLYRRSKHAEEIEAAYDKLEEAYERLETTTKAKERIESELRIARDIQMGMVPRIFPAFPDRNDIDIFATLTSAKEVGGDLYDFFLQNNRLYFCVGDVAGKGIPASLFMSVVVNIFRMVAKEGFPPQYIATKLNDALSTENENGMFCTMFIGEIDLQTGRMDFCNAGHNPPLVVDRPLGPHEPCRPSYIEMEANAPIGLWPDIEFKGDVISNVRGRTLFFYTDGLSEAENLSQEQFGEERLLKLFQTQPYDSTRQAVNLVQTAVSTFVGEAEPSDDLTMLCIRIK